MRSHALSESATGDVDLGTNFPADGASSITASPSLATAGALPPSPSQVAIPAGLPRPSFRRRRRLLQFGLSGFGLSLDDLLRSFFPDTNLAGVKPRPLHAVSATSCLTQQTLASCQLSLSP